MSTGVRELKLWQEAVALGGEVTRLVRQQTRREVRALTDQLMTTALGVATTVADGYGRTAATEQRDCYRRAKRLLAELETTLAIARHADLVSSAALAQITVRLGGVGRLLTGYLAFIERQVAAEAAVAAAAEVTALEAVVRDGESLAAAARAVAAAAGPASVRAATTTSPLQLR